MFDVVDPLLVGCREVVNDGPDEKDARYEKQATEDVHSDSFRRYTVRPASTGPARAEKIIGQLCGFGLFERAQIQGGYEFFQVGNREATFTPGKVKIGTS